MDNLWSHMLRDIRFLLKPRYAKSRALIIGINDYQAAPPLGYAVSDAEEVRDTLISEFNFCADDISYLEDGQATKANILRAFFRFTQEDVMLDDRIFIFFAGHGHTRTGIRGEIGYLVPHDADMSDFSTFIRWDELTRNADLIPAKHILFIMDACYGGLALTRNLQPGSVRFLRDMLNRYSRQVLTAGKADETVADAGGPLPNHSIFTGHLLEGLRGKAATDDGVITASGLMSYVYGKVANDKNSNQTPHYGYFDGDGDFIFRAPELDSPESPVEKDIDRLITIPFAEETLSSESTASKVQRVKTLLANDSSSIELHDFIIEEVRRFLGATDEDNFSMQEPYSAAGLIERISRYEELSNDLAALFACIAYWAKPAHNAIIQKAFARLIDRLEPKNGLNIWTSLRWYPIIIILYSAGISAVEGKQYDSLKMIFETIVPPTDYQQRDQLLLDAVGIGIASLNQLEVFKKLPGHERNHVPMSEYLFKSIQPRLDDILFIGKSYERSYDEFEILLALVVADAKNERKERVWGPPGRFAWKEQSRNTPPFSSLINTARSQNDNWAPTKAGLFGGLFDRFETVANKYQELISRLNFY